MAAISSIIVAIIMAILSIFGVGGGSSGGGSNNGGTTPVNTTPTGYDISADVSYGPHEQQKLDIAFPQGVGTTLGLAVHIHGGAWFGGDKSQKTDEVMTYAKEKNMITANVNYRLLLLDSPQYTCQTILEDIQAAMNKIAEVCRSKGYAVKKAMVWGESAGGHIALMYSYTYKDRCPFTIGLCYSICGPTNLTDAKYYTDNDIPPAQMLLLQSRLTGQDINAGNLLTESTANALLRVSPVNYVNAGTVPTIFNSCGRDKLVPKSNGDDLEKVLKMYGVDYYYAEFANSNHCGRSDLDYATYTALDNKLDQMINKYVK
ncbi:MAG: alpha/beta hydrolase [Clostridia bacterium]|nr:alpha/beta hydrolase [Clostridia bacterium]